MLRNQLLSLVVGATVLGLQRTWAAAPLTPAAYLVPPPPPPAFISPLPVPQRLTHAQAPTYASSDNSFQQPPYASPGFMTRIARWFGFGGTENSIEAANEGSPTDQQFASSHLQSGSAHYAHVNMLQRPQHQQLQQTHAKTKEPCSRCNHYPWVPMLPGNPVLYPLGVSQNAISPPQWAAAQQSFHADYQTKEYQQLQQQHSQVNQRAVKFNFPLLPLATSTATPPIRAAPSYSGQSLPFAGRAHFADETYGAHSEPQPERRPPPTPPADSGFEIVKSQQLTHFVSSVEYPAVYEQAQSIDVPSNHRPTANVQDEAAAPVAPAYSAPYQHDALNPLLSPHVPASQLLTDIGSFGDGRIAANNVDYVPPPTSALPPDNFPAASADNASIWQTEAEQGINTTPHTAPATSAIPPAALVIEQQHIDELRQAKGQLRGTSKRLIDAPQQHVNLLAHGPPRPFTRDPSELDYRLGGMLDAQPSTASWLVTPAPPAATSTYSAVDASGHFAGMSPPAGPSLPEDGAVQQIVIPYTTKNKPRPFETPTAYVQWSQSNRLEPHKYQASKLVETTSTAPSKRRTTKYLTKILASNLRELLRREQAEQAAASQAVAHVAPNGHNGHRPSVFDLTKLQQNIDDWTEQEFTSLSHRPSTPTIRGRSKHIPAEYLRTTPTPPPVQSPLQHSGKSLGFFDLSTSINNLESQLIEHTPSRAVSKSFEYVQPIDDNRLLESSPPSATSVTITTSTKPTTTAVSYIQTIPRHEATTPSSATELWRKAQVSISPLTMEKVYVVTPQPRHTPQRFGFVMTTTTESSSPAPRFAMRPTPRNPSTTTTNKPLLSHPPRTLSKLYSPELFGLMGLSAFIPAQPVEIIDGNSKVVSVTPPAKLAASEDHSKPLVYRQRATKATMSPSPR